MDIESSLEGTLLRHGTRRIKKYYRRNRSHRYRGDTHMLVCMCFFFSSVLHIIRGHCREKKKKRYD